MDKERFLVVTTMKNEGPFMLEWIAFNRAIGFDDFIIYTNSCEDGTDAIAKRLEELGLAAHIDNNKRKIGRNGNELSPQLAALRLAPRHEKYAAADWVICADVDEFLNIRCGTSLPDLVKASGPADAISVCWKLFGNDNRRNYEDVPITEQFFGCAPENKINIYREAGVKTLFRNNGAFERMGVHRPRVKNHKSSDPNLKPVFDGITWRDAGGNVTDPSKISWRTWKGFKHDYARLHHYAVRSADSFLVKRDRGRTNHVNMDQGQEYFDAMNANYERDYSILKHVPGMLTELTKLRSDKVLNELHAEAVEWHRAKIADIKSRDGWGDFIEMTYNHSGQARSAIKTTSADRPSE